MMSSYQAEAELIETTDGLTVVEEDGTTWDVFVDDGSGHYAIERDGGERWLAAQFSRGTVYGVQEGATFGVSGQDEYVARRVDNAGSIRWTENVKAV